MIHPEGTRSYSVLVDEPFYCSRCGEQFYVTGGNIAIPSSKRGRGVVRVYTFEDRKGEVHTLRSLRCPRCRGKLESLAELESLFGQPLRSF